MFELLKTLAEKLADVISFPAILKLKKDKKLTQIGSRLVRVYRLLNDIHISGTQIVEQFRKTAAWRKTKQKIAQNESRFRTHICNILEQERSDLDQLLEALKTLDLEFQIVDPEAYRQIIPLIAKMHDAISFLIRPCGQAHWRQAMGGIREMRAHLKAVEAVLVHFYEALQKHFSLQDVLLEVGARHCG